MEASLLPTITLRDISRAYGRAFALHRVNLELTQGTITALLGGNGAGKSTLLTILATIDRPTSGSLTYGLATLDQFRRQSRHRIGWVSHQTLLYEELTARENLNFFARMYGLDERERRCATWLERVGLTKAADQLVRTFSRGMKQRLTIARALLSNPRLLLLDEPATGLDQSGIDLLQGLLQELRERRRIIVLVTHNISLADTLADRIVVLRRGKVALDRPRSELSDLHQAYAHYS